MALDTPSIRIGVGLHGSASSPHVAVVAPPSCPYSLFPQPHTVPSSLAATVWYRPDLAKVTPVNPMTWTGTLLSVVVPSPSCPESLWPHAHSAAAGAAPAALSRGAATAISTRTSRAMVVSAADAAARAPPECRLMSMVMPLAAGPV